MSIFDHPPYKFPDEGVKKVKKVKYYDEDEVEEYSSEDPRMLCLVREIPKLIEREINTKVKEDFGNILSYICRCSTISPKQMSYLLSRAARYKMEYLFAGVVRFRKEELAGLERWQRENLQKHRCLC